ncbi:nitric-oxide reductase large subunit [Effusibacillus lacus]|uniref:Nitric oxide reductase n=1 Tax=Effusibacillus lacus TaxID=1348429 RepID=A0A292YSI0_9BACL|nr:nitric-oxide reductase large subunit [Effusibacillus lacus]TCS76102.1 nitric oxide reductase NorZ apoprotein [Effusibacillus lacus]GAX91384.1 nitric oxide reductase [Effusibacillus lacus]
MKPELGGPRPGLGKKTNSILKQILILTLIVSFSVLLFGGYAIYKNTAPEPERIVTQDGLVLTTYEQIKGGQAVYQKYGLMDWGTTLGHGSYLGPDFTAEALHIYLTGMHEHYAKELHKTEFAKLTQEQQNVIIEKVKLEARENRYDAATGTLTLTAAQAAGLEKVRAHYKEMFTKGDFKAGLPENLIREEHMPATGRNYVAEGDQLQQIADFFFWTAWLSSTERPGLNYTYTNNWPYEEYAGNGPSYSSMWWSAVSVVLLILFTGVILYFYKRYNFEMEEAYEPGKFPKISLKNIAIYPSQRKAAKYFLVVTLLFLVQSLLGAALAHYYVEGNGFYGFDISTLLPFSAAKGYHLQLAIFWIATAWLAMGIYVAPLVSGREPKGQGLLVDILFWALIVVVAGSMIGEWLGVKGYLGNLWFLLGHQGWEYLELGRIWQILLATGLGIWLFIVGRGLKDALKSEEDKGGLVHLLFYSSIAVVFFYLFAFLINPGTHLTYADYWRWWIIHLWVEGIFEVFAVVVIGFLMVQMGLVTKKSTVRALLFQFTILLGSGVIGTGHHYYWVGVPDFWIALGAVFSALEVIPLTLLILEAWGQYKIMKDGGADFPYKGSFSFLISVAIWNLVGAGGLGFLINMPIVSYYQHGTQLTPAHGHGAMVGVYGFFSVAIMLYTMRNLVKPEAWNERLEKFSVWALNIGLAGMIAITLLPMGFLQLKKSYTDGFWAARAFEFYQDSTVNLLLWLRIIPDSVFLLGILPLVLLMWKAMRNLRPVDKQ